MAYGIPARAVMIALMALNKETRNTELKRRYGLDLKKAAREKLNLEGLLQSRSLGAKGFAHELTDAGWAWVVAELDAQAPPRAGSAGGALYALLNGLKVALDARGMVIQELFEPIEPTVPRPTARSRIGFGRPTATWHPDRGIGWSCATSGRSSAIALAVRWTWRSRECFAKRTSISRCTRTAAGSRRPIGTRRSGSAWTTCI